MAFVLRASIAWAGRPATDEPDWEGPWIDLGGEG